MAITAPPSNITTAPVVNNPDDRNRNSGTILGNRKTWRGQIVMLTWLLSASALVALLLTVSATSSRIDTFQRIASVAVPSIDTTNQAVQLLSAQVANNAEYILAGQTKVAASTDTGATADKATLLKRIESQRAAYDIALQQGFKALITSQNETQPDITTALNYLSNSNTRLQDVMALARGLSERGDQATATRVFLDGQNNYYQPVISSLYYLRSVYSFRLEDAAQEATNAANPWITLTIALTALFAASMAFTTFWLTFKIKRVLNPLLNVALIAAIAYAWLIWSAYSDSRTNLINMVASYNTGSLLNDAQLYTTDAATDQVQWVIGGKPVTDAGATNKFSGDPVYEQDFKTKTELLLATKNAKGEIITDAQAIPACPNSASQRTNYPSVGAVAEVCRQIASTQELSDVNRFVQAYKSWLATDANFRNLVLAGRVDEGLALRTAKPASDNYQLMSDSLVKLRQSNVNDYNRESKAGLDKLNLLAQLAWVIYPVSLLMAITTLFLWRREF